MAASVIKWLGFLFRNFIYCKLQVSFARNLLKAEQVNYSTGQ